jgi:hypothetical protein
MTAIQDKHTDRIGRAAILLPILAVLLNLAGSFIGPTGNPSVATALLLASFLLVFASIPFAGVVAIQARLVDRTRLRRALIGFSLGLGFSALFIYGTWLVNAKTRAIQLQLESQQAEQNGTGQPATRPVFESEGNDKPQPEAEGRSR